MLPTNAPLLTVEDVARRLNVKKPHVYELIRRRLLPAVHVGRLVRVSEAKLDAFIEQGGEQFEGGWKKEV